VRLPPPCQIDWNTAPVGPLNLHRFGFWKPCSGNGSTYAYGLRHCGFRAEGEVRLQSARIGTVLDCDGGAFNNPPRLNTSASGYALTADNMTVSGRVAMGRGFRANGEVFMIGSQIGGDLDCAGGEFNNPAIGDTTLLAGRALSAHLRRLLHLWVGIRNAPGILSSNVARIALFALASCMR
jgi:hypothetical protein